MGKLRVRETKRFPCDSRDCWYILVDSKLVCSYFTGSVGGKVDLSEKIDFLLNQKEKFVVFGIWHGEWRTDAFELEPKLLLKKLKKVLKD